MDFPQLCTFLLQKRRQDLLTLLRRSNLKDFTTELRRRLVFSPQDKDNFDSLDFDTIDVSLQVRYVMQQVQLSLLKEPCLFINFLEAVATLDVRVFDCLKKDYQNQLALAKTKGNTGADGKGIELYFLTESDIPQLLEVLVEISFKWEELGMMLGLPRHVIEECRKGDSNATRLGHILYHWIISHNATLEALKVGLMSPVVGACKVAESLSEKLKSGTEFIESGHNTSPFRIIYQSCDTTVADGKSLLLEIQVQSSSPVSYLWTKGRQNLTHGQCYSGVNCSILHISKANQETNGIYSCFLKAGDMELVSEEISVLVKYSSIKEHFVSIYSHYKEVPTESWPGVEGNNFINLVVNKQHSTRNRLRLLSTKVTDAFKFYTRNYSCLVEGLPGTGKTSMSRRLVTGWAKGEVLKSANMVFLIPMRFCSLDKMNDLADVIKQLYLGINTDVLDEYIQNIEKLQGKGLCIILDGLDENYPNNARFTVIDKLLHKEYLPLCMTIAFSRPERALVAHRYDESFNLVGFEREGIKMYIDNFSFSNSEKASSLNKYLESHNDILQMCYTPMYTAMICILHNHEVNSAFTTETKMYEQIIKFTFLKYYKLKTKSAQSIVSSSQSELGDEELIENCFLPLSKLAYDMTVASKTVISGKDIPKDLAQHLCFGLMTASQDSELVSFKSVHKLSFIHATIQEFFTAYHLSCTNPDKHLINWELTEPITACAFSNSIYNPYKKTSSSMKFMNVCKFFSGLYNFKNKKAFFQRISDLTFVLFEKSDEIIHATRLAYESQQPNVCNFLIEATGGIATNSELEVADVTDINYVISNSSTPLQIFCIVQTSVTSELARTLWMNIEKSKLAQLCHLTLCFVNFDDLKIMFVSISFCTALEKLDLSNNKLYGTQALELAEHFKDNQCLKILCLADNNISDDIVGLAEYLNKMDVLDLTHNPISSAGICDIVKHLKFIVNLLLFDTASISQNSDTPGSSCNKINVVNPFSQGATVPIGAKISSRDAELSNFRKNFLRFLTCSWYSRKSFFVSRYQAKTTFESKFYDI